MVVPIATDNEVLTDDRCFDTVSKHHLPFRAFLDCMAGSVRLDVTRNQALFSKFTREEYSPPAYISERTAYT